ncbi:MAG: sigma-70 family RNA polymerase sigma factor [Anaerolineaceae bacterium]|nr:sigma-70 family RNA polymerase sigma factor [Anaerolineaceae bacterium]MBN2678415.1 sigma-70 family RNA polymerase sigma factor [Anaerolineaceae bacterium]
MDETQLIKEAKSGDVDAFNSLVLAYQVRVYNLAYRILSDEDSAEDTTQTVFLTAYQKLSGFRGGSFLAWILRITTNQCYDRLRYAKRHPTASLEPLNDDDESMESPAWMKDSSSGPEVLLDQAELERAIQQCINALPADYRMVAVLVDVQGMDYQSVAEIIKTPMGTVKSRLARARLKLRDCLSGIRELMPSSIRLNMEGNK